MEKHVLRRGRENGAVTGCVARAVERRAVSDRCVAATFLRAITPICSIFPWPTGGLMRLSSSQGCGASACEIRIRIVPDDYKKSQRRGFRSSQHWPSDALQRRALQANAPLRSGRLHSLRKETPNLYKSCCERHPE